MQMIIPAISGNTRRLIIPMTFRNVPLVAVVSVVSVALVAFVGALVAVIVVVVATAATTVPLQYVPLKLPTHTHDSFLVLELYKQPPLSWHGLDSHIGPQCVLRHTGVDRWGTGGRVPPLFSVGWTA